MSGEMRRDLQCLGRKTAVHRQKLPPPLARFPIPISGQFMYSLVQLPTTSRQLQESDSGHNIISWNIDNTFNHNWPAVTHGTEPDKILHTEADLCYFTGLFIPTINLANSKPKHIFLVTRLERLFLKSTIG